MAVQISGNDITVPRDGSFTRNVTIGGTLTYEDVTNIDSVGLVTARNGIEIGARPGVAASISVDGNMIVSGISTFGGNIAGQTASFAQNLAIRLSSATNNLHVHQDDSDKSIAQFTNNTTGSASGDGFQIGLSSSEEALLNMKESSNMVFKTADTERLRIDSSGRLLLGLASDSRTTSMIISGNTSGATSFGVLNIDIGTTSVSADTNLGIIRFGATGDRRGADIRGMGDGTWNAGSSHPTRLSFYTCASSATSPTESLRIDSSGRVLIGTTTEGHVNGDDLTVATSGNTGITIRSGTSNAGNIYFSDATSGDGEYKGYISYGHNIDGLYFATGATNRMLIDSTGRTLIGTTSQNNNAKLQVTTDQQVVATFEGTGVSDPQIYLGDNMASPVDNCIILGYDKADNRGYLTVGGDADTVFQVKNGGDIEIGIGNLKFGTAGKGIDFSSSQTPSSKTGATTNSEVFDHYEEGTFTPTYDGTWTNISNSNVRHSRYTRVGDVCHVWMEYYMTNNNGAYENNSNLRGFPFTGRQSLYVPVSLTVMYGPSGYTTDAGAAGRAYFDSYDDRLYFKMGSYSSIRHMWIQFSYLVG